MPVPPPSSDAERDIPHLATYRPLENNIDRKATPQPTETLPRHLPPVESVRDTPTVCLE
jgi:hypothetical protein